MAQLSYASFDANYSISTTGTVNRNFPSGSVSLGDAAVITHAATATATLNARSTFSPDNPTDAIGLLGCNLIRGDQIGWEGIKNGVTQFSRALTTIADDWPLGKARNFAIAIPRDSSGEPVYTDILRFFVRFSGTRFFGRIWTGPSILFAPTVDLSYSFSDPGAKVDRTITGAASFTEMPVRRSVALACHNVSQATAFDAADLLPAGQTVPLIRNFRSLFDAGYLRRGSRMLLVPNEVEPYASRMAEYCRLNSDVALKHLRGPLLSLSLSVEED